MKKINRELYVVAISAQWQGELVMSCGLVEAMNEDEANGIAMRLARGRWPGHHGYLTAVEKLDTLKGKL